MYGFKWRGMYYHLQYKKVLKNGEYWKHETGYLETSVLVSWPFRTLGDSPHSDVSDYLQNVVTKLIMGFPGGSSGKEPTCQCWRRKRHRFDPWVGKIPCRRKWQLTPVALPGEFHGRRSLMGCGPWDRRAGHDGSNLERSTQPCYNSV